MIELVYVASLYLLAIIGVVTLLFIILAIYICYRYDVKVHIHSKDKAE